MNFIHDQSIEVAVKLQETLEHDAKERLEQLTSGQALYYIHNIALFECLVWLNAMCSLSNASKETFDEYLCFADTFRDKFMNIAEGLKGFQLAA